MGDRSAVEGVTEQWTGQRSSRVNERPAARHGLYVGLGTSHWAAFHAGSCNAVVDGGCNVMYGQSRRGKGKGKCGRRVCVVPPPRPLQQFSATFERISPSAPTASARLKSSILACSVAARSDRIRICMMSAQRWLVRLPWVPKPLWRPPLHESAEGSSKSRSLGYAIDHHLPIWRFFNSSRGFEPSPMSQTDF